MTTTAFVLTLKCVDRPGIVAAVSSAIFAVGGNITDSAQSAHDEHDTFTLRMEVDVPANEAGGFSAHMAEQLAQFDPVLSVRPLNQRRRAMILVSSADHCLWDLLYHFAAGDLPLEITAVASNHETLRELVESYGIAFHFIPVTPETKADAERALTTLVEDSNTDFIVLARYMQILSNEFCARYDGRIVNIHHSFLPGFKGAKPYLQAYERGVKLIGATAHFVTSELDEGPIIEQDVVRVNHRMLEQDLAKIGRDVERRVLTRAVKLYAEDRVFLTGNRTVVFD